jgi:hypothetical protein
MRGDPAADEPKLAIRIRCLDGLNCGSPRGAFDGLFEGFESLIHDSRQDEILFQPDRI